jgi:hypothetical protein
VDKLQQMLKQGCRKLHLGCGGNYLSGYINIDFPIENTIQTRRHDPDIEADFTTLSFPGNYFNEIMLFHVFEHFQRHHALGLLCKWNKMLVDHGRLHLAMPDVEKCMQEFVGADEYRRGQLIRHIFGSHEAFWATHHEGWYPGSAKAAYAACGFQVLEIIPGGGEWTAFEIIGIKHCEPNYNLIEEFLKPYDSNCGLMSYWMDYIRSV